MNRFLYILPLFLSLGVLLSCGQTKDERDLIKSFTKGYHPSDEITLNCHLSRKDKSLSVGTLELEYDGETATFPVKVIKDDSGSRHWEFSASQEVVDFTFSSFLVRANHVNNWGEMSKYLSGDTLSEYERYDKEMTRYLENNIFRTHTTSYMEHNNRYVNNYIKPFVDKLGGNPNIYQSLIITEEQRAQDEQEFHDWSRQAVKDARNKWVDDNPQEARRRGITKF